MKPFAILLLAASFLVSTELKTGYYLTLKDFINNTPTPAEAKAQVVSGNDEMAAHSFDMFRGQSINATAYYVEEQEKGEFKRVHAKAFSGYCDSGKVYLVDNANIFKGRIMRSTIVGTRFSYFFGIDVQTNSGGFKAGHNVSTPGGAMNVGGGFTPSTSSAIPVLVVVDMKTGETKSIKQDLFQVPMVKSLFAEFPEVFQTYKSSKQRELNEVSTYIDKINSMPN